MSAKKILKRLAFTLLSLVVIIALAIAFALNFIFTPEKITPTIVDLVNENLDAKLECESVELTFFSSFPHFEARVVNGNLMTPTGFHGKNDTLLHFSECRAAFDARKLWFKRDLVVHELAVKKPNVQAIMHQNGKANWEIVKPSEPEEKGTDTSSFKIKSILIKKFLLEHARVSYHDYTTKAHAKIADLNLELSAHDTESQLTLDTKLHSKNLDFSKDGYWFAKKLKVDFETAIKLDKKSQRVDFDKSSLKLNDIDFNAEGHFRKDAKSNGVYTDVQMQMKVPSLMTLWKTIPTHIIETKDVEVHGNVVFNLNSKGLYTKGQLPATDIVFKITDGSLHYKKFPGEITHLETDVTGRIDFENPEKSKLDIKNLLLKGTGADLAVNAKIERLLKAPKVSASVKGDLNLTTIQEKFPLGTSLKVHGFAHLDLTGNFNPEEIMAQNYRNLDLKGDSRFSELVVKDPADSIFVSTGNTHLFFGGKSDVLAHKGFGKVEISDLSVKYGKWHDLKLEKATAKIGAKREKDSIKGLRAEIGFSKLQYLGADKLKCNIRKAHVTARLGKNRRNKPAIETTFELDSAGVWQDKKFVGIKKGNYKLSVSKNRDQKWMPRGTVEFSRLFAYIPDFALPLRMEHSVIGINNRAITLHNAHLFFGNSDVTLSGSINNVLAKRSPDNKIDAKLRLDSNFIDANQIMEVLAKHPTNAPQAKEIADAGHANPKSVKDKKTVFQIPNNISFVFDSHVKKMHYGTLDMKDLHGNLTIADGHLKLSRFEMVTLAAKLRTSLKYSTESETKAKVDFDFNLDDVEMANISKIMPAMDSLFPMAKSFEGKAHFRMRGRASLNKNMDVDINSVRSIAALQAHDVMVLDGETYRDIAKTLFFKDREYKTIQRLDMEMIIEKSHMEILPALLEIDRYRLAIGGTQNLDLTYNYHISVLKSPIPFKTGFDVKGNLDDYKISLTKAKYKYYFSDKQRDRDKADEAIVRKKNAILKRLELDKS